MRPDVAPPAALGLGLLRLEDPAGETQHIAGDRSAGSRPLWSRRPARSPLSPWKQLLGRAVQFPGALTAAGTHGSGFHTAWDDTHGIHGTYWGATKASSTGRLIYSPVGARGVGGDKAIRRPH